jgi:hypothetical protein
MLNPMKYVIAAVFIAAGAYLIYCGHCRAGSIAGFAERTGKNIADVFDGRIRNSHYIVYYTSGCGLIAAGAWVALHKQKPRDEFP